MTDLIGLHGKGYAGKDTTCAFLRDILRDDRDVVRDAFADRLKRSACAALGLPWESRNPLKEHGTLTIEIGGQVTTLSGRSYLERYGTEAHRDIFTDTFWIDMVMAAFKVRGSGPLTVITDVRYENEVQAVKDADGEVWKLKRPGRELESSHATNRALPDDLFDRVIYNDDDLPALREKVKIAAFGAGLLPAVLPNV